MSIKNNQKYWYKAERVESKIGIIKICRENCPEYGSLIKIGSAMCLLCDRNKGYGIRKDWIYCEVVGAKSESGKRKKVSK